RRFRFDGTGERVAAERAEAYHTLFDLLARLQLHAIIVDHDQHTAAVHDGSLLRKIERDDGNVFLQDVLPDVELGPVGERKDTDRLALCNPGVVDLPHFRTLVLRIPGVT